jgi:hypothetical protein
VATERQVSGGCSVNAQQVEFLVIAAVFAVLGLACLVAWWRGNK